MRYGKVVVRSLTALTLTAMATFAVAAASAQEPPMKSELEGAWACTSAIIDGQPLAAETAKSLTLVLTGDRYKSQRGDQVLFDSSYTTDAKKTPKQIDMIATEGEFKGKAAQGIHKLEDDTLTLCYTMPGMERPTAFNSQPRSGTFLVTYQRAKGEK
jgi:uncharacterized protein (TIGR03067 family)